MDDTVAETALGLPGTYMTEQWGGSHVFKVGDAKTFKMFAILRPGGPSVCVKTPSQDVADILIEAGVAEREVHLPRSGWCNLLYAEMDEKDVLERVRESYDIVRMTLPKRMRDSLAEN